MISQQKAANYARALFNCGEGVEEIHRRDQDLQCLSDAFREAPQLLHILSNPILAYDNKMALLTQIRKQELSPDVQRLIYWMIKHKKVKAMRQVASEYHKMVISSLKEIDVEISVAEPLSQGQQELLRKKLEKRFQKKINLIQAVETSLLGGFVLLVYNRLLDLSIKGIITRLKKQVEL